MVEGRNISYSRGFLPLFSDLSFLLKEGDLLALRGANGTGKSTLLRLLTGLICPPQKTLFWKGEELGSRNLTLYQQELLYVGHKLALHPEARVKDQLYLWKTLYKISEKAIEEALLRWEVIDFKEKKISHLSQGQQKRLSLSRCHWLNRPLWILDEPQAGLDKKGKVMLSEALSHHIQKGGAAVIATHESLLTGHEIYL
jgi:heme exporter protein A